MPAAHVFSKSVHGPVHAHESARGTRKPSGEPAATSARALGYSRLHSGAQRHARPAFAAFEPVEPHSDMYCALTCSTMRADPAGVMSRVL
eukprot:3741158-Prymnesium_polylepis.1